MIVNLIKLFIRFLVLLAVVIGTDNNIPVIAFCAIVLLLATVLDMLQDAYISQAIKKKATLRTAVDSLIACGYRKYYKINGRDNSLIVLWVPLSDYNGLSETTL